jgi:hypothetical protein
VTSATSFTVWSSEAAHDATDRRRARAAVTLARPRSNDRVRVLVLYPYLPYPGVPHGSGRLVEPLLSLWRERGVSVSLVCGYRPGERDYVEATRALVDRLFAVATPLRVDRGPVGRLVESARTAFFETTTGRPRHVVKLDRGGVRRALRSALAEGPFDVAQVEIGGAAAYVDALGPSPKVLVDHEAGTASGDDLASDRRSVAFVRATYPRFDRVVALCEEDAADLRAVVPGLRTADPNDVVPGRCLFFGSAEHEPNRDALLWLATEIWPRVRALRPDASGVVATGELPAALSAALDSAGLKRLGFVKDVAAEIRRAALVLAPLRKGRGVRIKNVEALAVGRPLLTTTLGARGLPVAHDRDVWIADSTEAFVEGATTLLSDRARAEALGVAARGKIVAALRHDAAADADVALWRELARR